MEHPKTTGEEKQEAAAETERMSSAQQTDQSPTPKPDPKPAEANGEQQKDEEENGDQKPKKEENNSNSLNKGNLNNLRINTNNESNKNESGSGSNKSASPLSSRSKKSVSWSEELVTESPVPRSSEDRGSNPYVAYSSSPLQNSTSFNMKNTMENVKDVLGRWGRKVGEATRKAEDLAGNTWQHLKTSPSIADAALGRIAQGTKVLAEGGHEKIFRQTFETVPEEQLQNSYACYLSTSAGPVMGVLYVSTAKIAFCSDSPLSYKAGDKTEWSYYKVVIPLHQLKAVNPSSSRTNSAEKYIQVISIDNHEFWYMGFLNYDGAVKCLEVALQAGHLQAV